MKQQDSTPKTESKDPRFTAPTVSLPKGGGAIRGIGEKFSANLVTGTGSFSIPLPLSPGRSGFTPALGLSYDSGSGNGPYGFGWNVSYPQITRRTDRGLPQYHDDDESDVYILSGAEDLVPIPQEDGLPFEVRDGFRVTRYRPRIEGLLARIERWRSVSEPSNVFWRSISRENVTTVYGKGPESRIVDPVDPARIFSWLLCESFDDKGNAAVYEYVAEDDRNVDVARTSEANRSTLKRSSNRYLKRARYGNRVSRLVEPDLTQATWLFELVMDYGDHEGDVPAIEPAAAWAVRPDPFSTYRAGFEVRTYRRCKRVLMFHSFSELGPEPKLVRSLVLDYQDLPPGADLASELAHQGSTPIGSFLVSATLMGYAESGLSRSLPPVEFAYSRPKIEPEIQTLDAASLENLPIGVDGARYQWVDLDGEGLSGILAEQAGAWWYKRNLGKQLGPLELVARKPSVPLEAGAQLLDLAGDGQLDLVQFAHPTAGFFEREGEGGWSEFTTFRSQPNIDWADPNLRHVDLSGDGHADVLITEHDVFTWHPSLGEEGFGPSQRVRLPPSEEECPRLVFADGEQSVYLADLSGDGLTDLVRVRNGEVCYWPNLGYGRFGAKVTMDHAPWFDAPDQFNQQRVRLADIDGSGATDIIYLGRDGVRLYFNQAGNAWSEALVLRNVPSVDNLSSVVVTDLLGNGTACLVWSSPLPGDVRQSLRYLDLMGGTKPHLLVQTANNLGAETLLEYAASTKFYLSDRRAGRPWITRLPFPVHVVERVTTSDRISRNRFVTRYSYHHGYFDGVEREFRGFGMVEQLDTEEFAALEGGQELPATNVDAASHVPPVLTRTWFHTGMHLGGEHVSDFFAGLLNAADTGEYYREPGLSDEQARQLLLEDTVLPSGLSAAEEREARRALKGVMLRQEVYALDSTALAEHPYTVTEQNFTLRRVQPLGENRHAVFLSHPRESIAYHYERNPSDPRIAHSLTLEVDDFGNVLQSAAVAYGRRRPDPLLEQRDRDKQAKLHITCVENRVTNFVDEGDAYRTPAPCETRTYELTGLSLGFGEARLALVEVLAAATSATPISYETEPSPNELQKRLIEHLRTLFEKDDLSGPLALGQLQSRALPFETYKLAFTPQLLEDVYDGRIEDAMLLDKGGYVHSADQDGEEDDQWWIPSGRVYFSGDPNEDAAAELDHALRHFFLPHRYEDPFLALTTLRYDVYDLLVQETRDALENVVLIGELDDAQQFVTGNDYRVLQPRLVTDPNGNRSAVSFDALGMVVGTAVMGKRSGALRHGDLLDGLVPDLPPSTAMEHLDHPLVDPHAILTKATTRLVYDLFAYQRTREQAQPSPIVVYTLARETHDADLLLNQKTKVQHSFSYSDGFGREIQKKVQAEPGPVPQRDPLTGHIVVSDGEPVMTTEDAPERWVGSGWTVFNNKGKPVRQFEPFFTDLHGFEFDVRIGVSPFLFYDPIERVVGTLHPNHTWEKVRFDAWRQESWDVNDTVLIPDPKQDPEVGSFFLRLDEANYLPTWYSLRQTPGADADEKAAATKTSMHAATPAVAHADSLGRTFLTVAHNRFKAKGSPDADPPTEERYATRVIFDIEGNQRQVVDAQDRIVMKYDYDMLGQRIHQASMEAGQRWMLGDVMGKALYAWDSRGHRFHTGYDLLRRPTDSFLLQGAGPERTIERTIYGESQLNPEIKNQRGKAVKAFDQAGVVTNENYDFKGNLLVGRRQLAGDYKTSLDWSVAPPPPLGEIFASSTIYDALNRPVEVTTPDLSVHRSGFNEANLLERVDVNLRGALSGGARVWTHFVTGINYNAKGQRERLDYANGASTTYAYDRFTFRLTRLRTTRVASSGSPFSDSLFKDATRVQALSYTYDPAGNISHIVDDALVRVFHGSDRVDPISDYTYDAVYRLIHAEGREHIGQTALDVLPPTGERRDFPFLGTRANPNDLQALRSYTEDYAYDEVGNIQALSHKASGTTWTRDYVYAEQSLLEDIPSNRLSSTSLGGADEIYSYRDALGNDVHGCITAINNRIMVWDFKDQLQSVDLGGGGTAYYVYDASGQRIRKILEDQAGTRQTERIYLGGYEVFRKFDSAGALPDLERETVHVMDDKQRIAFVETQTIEDGTPIANPESVLRYQLGNHLGSSSVELDADGGVISYEEYHPYGTTSLQAMTGAAEVSLKRYRYTGMERDEETGLSYHLARYYSPWLGRWTSTDPLGRIDGENLYAYVRDGPVQFTDSRGTFIDPGDVDPVVKVVTTGEVVGGAVAVLTAPEWVPVAIVGAATAAAVALVWWVFPTSPGSTVEEGPPIDAGVPPPSAGAPVSDPTPAPDPTPTPEPKADPKQAPQLPPKPKSDEDERKPRFGRIYVNYIKIQDKSGLVYSGRTSMVVDLNRPRLPQAIAAVELRGANHHKEDEGYSPALSRKEWEKLQQKNDEGPALITGIGEGNAVDYGKRYADQAYLANRGMEQQSTDAYGGAWSDTGKPYKTGNAVRGVGKDHKWGLRFHKAATRAFGEQYRYTGN